jgi:phosphorylcholine metabolism protein LicD
MYFLFLYVHFFGLFLGHSFSPQRRRKKLNMRMKSFSLDAPDTPRQLLSIDETAKKKSSSSTSFPTYTACFGG